MSWDEALALPTEEAALLALRTQQIVAYEIGRDPDGRSARRLVLPRDAHRRARAAGGARCSTEVEAHGVLRGHRGRLARAGDRRGRLPPAGGDRDAASASSSASTASADERADEQEIEILSMSGGGARPGSSSGSRETRAERDGAAVERVARRRRAAAAARQTNTMPAILDAVRAYATVGEISAALGDGLRLPQRLDGRLMRPGCRALDHVGIAAPGRRPSARGGARRERRHRRDAERRRDRPLRARRPGRARDALRRPGNPIERFLERRGPGLHHVAFRVDEPLASVSRALRADGDRAGRRDRAVLRRAPVRLPPPGDDGRRPRRARRGPAARELPRSRASASST